ncbi:MAG: arginine--tRNA ligase, partial [Planctomycetota bacterium]
QVIVGGHLGDWGTQFGMIIYGYKHFADPAAFDAAPVMELLRIYRLVNQLVNYRKTLADAPRQEQAIAQQHGAIDTARDALDAALAKDASDKSNQKETKKRKKQLATAEKRLAAMQSTLQSDQQKIADVESDPTLAPLLQQHAEIDRAVLQETAALHEGDAANRELWNKFLPHCLDEINGIYRRLGIQFDHVLGESFYHPMLADTVQRLRDADLVTDSEGAVCVFLPQFDAPMIVQKKDGAFLYSTTDLATLQYRKEHFDADEILYVVDARQGEHFDKLFAVAEKLGFNEIELRHIAFGTVNGPDGKPMKTKSGSLIGLEFMLDESVAAARAAVCDPDRVKTIDPPLSDEEMDKIANVIGHGAIKYADLAHHRTTDYKFDLKKMVALEGNTIVYVMYAFARTQGILRKCAAADGDPDASPMPAADNAEQHGGTSVDLSHESERRLALLLLRFPETLQSVRQEYAPNILVDYLFDVAKRYSAFNDNCPVLKAATPQQRFDRLTLVTAAGNILKQGLELLGIPTVQRM